MSELVPAAAAPLRIVVLCGGPSAEREISLKSGQAVAEALRERGHHVELFDPQDADVLLAKWDNVDAAFIALHGAYGEDGKVQTELDRLGVPYTGSSPEASEVAFSKSACKERLLQHGVPTPPYLLVHACDGPKAIAEKAEQLGFPLVVKPDTQGSSIGVSIVETAEALPAALKECFRFDDFGILETAIIGSEWTLGMLDDQPLPLLQIETEGKFYDYTAKYESLTTRYTFEWNVTADAARQIESVGQCACAVLGTRGLARVDIRVDVDGRPWVLEVNTVPGMTAHSLIPKAAARLGVSFPLLCEAAVVSCLQQTRV